MTADYHDEQSRRLNAIGLDSEEAIAANENYRCPPVPDHRRPALIDTSPPLLPIAKIEEYARVDGYIDACTDRPPSAAIRFIEARLHYANMDHFGRYLATYEQSYAKKRKAA